MNDYEKTKEEIIAELQILRQQQQNEDQLRKTLAEKSALLREVFHGTRNNMATIIAMLELRMLTLDDGAASKDWRNMANRVRSIALVHQLLYQSQDLSGINLRAYVNELVGQLQGSYQIDPNRVRVVVDVQEVRLILEVAVPCGLILNELISNALQHAFPGRRAGQVQVQLYRSGENEVTLRVSDDGVGAPAGFDWRETDTLGLQILQSTAENQLNGQVDFQTWPGVTCQVRFRDDLYERRG